MSESVPPDDDDQLHASATRLINRADALLNRGAKSLASQDETPPPPPPAPKKRAASAAKKHSAAASKRTPPASEPPPAPEAAPAAPTTPLFNAVRPTMHFGIASLTLNNYVPNAQPTLWQAQLSFGAPQAAPANEAPPAPPPEEVLPLAEEARDLPPPPRRPVSELALAEHLLSIEADLTRALEQWLASELPELLQQEFAVFAAELHTRLSAHARATLTTVLSESIAEGLSKAAAEPEEPEEPPTE